MAEYVLQQKSIEFGIRIVNLYKYLNFSKQEHTLSKQLLRSGTSIGANVHEAIYAESPTDMSHKYSIAQKECSETDYWLLLLYKTDYINQTEYESMNKDNTELMKILAKAIINLKGKG